MGRKSHVDDHQAGLADRRSIDGVDLPRGQVGDEQRIAEDVGQVGDVASSFEDLADLGVVLAQLGQLCFGDAGEWAGHVGHVPTSGVRHRGTFRVGGDDCNNTINFLIECKHSNNNN